MDFGWLTSGPRHLAWVVALLVLFTLAGTVHYTTSAGGDLAPSYAACRLMAVGQGEHMYSYDPTNFTEVGNDAVWTEAARSGGVTGSLHPYVQTPLWATMLRPLCTRTSFLVFDRVFAALTLGSFAGIVWLVGRYWVPELLNPYAVATILLLLYLTTPFRFAMLLMQTHVLFLLLIVGALLLAERKRPISGGLLLAYAAAVKITPGFLAVYWLLGRRWRAAVSAMIWSALLWGITLAACGQTLVRLYLANLNRISGTLLISAINQSFAAWWMGRNATFAELEQLHSFSLPHGLRVASTALMLVCLLTGGLMDRYRTGRTPLGAMVALVGTMIFSPIAWTHYFVILLIPLMLLMGENLPRRSVWVKLGIAVVVLLNFHIPEIVRTVAGLYLPERGAFYSGALCLALLGYVDWLRRDGSAHTAVVRSLCINTRSSDYKV